MKNFSIPDMMCGHCKKTVEEAIHKLDGAAKIEIDLDKHTAAVQSTVNAEQLLGALDQVGYPSQLV